MASYCLYDTLNALAPCDPGGFWQYISGPTDVLYSPTCGNPCPSPVSKMAGDVLGATTGCLTCTDCVVTTDNPCVTFTLDPITAFVFRYSTKCIGDCCEPDPDCTADLVFEAGGATVTIADMASVCQYDASITYPATDLQNNSQYMTSHMKVDGNSPTFCFPQFENYTLNDTLSGRTANGFELPLHNDMGACEICAIEKFKVSINKSDDSVVHSPYLSIVDALGTCGMYACNWNGSNGLDVALFYQCAFDTLISTWANTQGDGSWDPGTHFECVVSWLAASSSLSIKMINKHVFGQNLKWAGFDTDAGDDISWREDGGGMCNYDMTTESTTFDYVDNMDPGNTADFNETFGWQGGCFNDAVTMTGRFNNIANLSTTKFNKLAPNATADWNVLTAPVLEGYTDLGGGNYTISCGVNELTAELTGCGSPTYEWKDSMGNIIGTMATLSWGHNLTDGPECIQVTVTCDGGCVVCSHICLTSTPPYYTGAYTGDCSTGCSNNSSCA